MEGNGQTNTYQQLAEIILGVTRPHPVRVAIDGIDAAGKTTLADKLVEYLAPSHRPILRASIDGFHHPRKVRYRQGRNSADGYFRDSFDLVAVRRELLEPLGPEGDGFFRPHVFDYRTDRRVEVSKIPAGKDAILLFDGVFLCQLALRDCWDLVIYLKISYDTGLARGIQRNTPLPDGESDTRRLYQVRYHRGQRTYHQECDPEGLADVVVDNEDFHHPRIISPGLSQE